MVFAAVRTHLPRNVHFDRHLVTGKEISGKINICKLCQRSKPGRIVSACNASELGSMLSGDMIFSFLLLFYLNGGILTN